jgi:cell division septation protein DedD
MTLHSCFNNCPDDSRASSAQSQVQIYCQQASLYGTRTKTTKTATAETEGTGTADATATGADASEETASSTSSSSSPDSTNNAADLARNTGGVLLAVAGVVAAML